MEKLCLFCQHFDFESIGVGPDYSSMTGGDPYGGLSCLKKHYVEERPDNTQGLRKVLLTAETCLDYTPPESKSV